MRIWIDITNSPHVLFFRPLIARMKADGHHVTVTARRYAQTVPLLHRLGIDFELIGRHGGRNRLGKALRFIHRLAKLIDFALWRRFDIAIGHASNDLCVVARLFGIPQVTTFDYEYASLSHSINLKLVDQCLVPKWIPTSTLTPYGIAPQNIIHYGGLKEEVYLWDFNPDCSIIDHLALDKNKPIVTFRPPATMAAYHPKTAHVTWQIANMLAERDGVQVVCLPRTDEQRREFQRKAFRNFVYPKDAVDGPSLIYCSDLVICGGGTMNREAAAMNTPVWAIFEGTIGAVDRHLASQGRVKIVSDINDVAPLTISKKTTVETTVSPAVFNEVYGRLLSTKRKPKWPFAR